MKKGTMINAFDPALAEGIEEDTRALIDRRKKALGPAYRLFYAKPVHFVRAEGVYLYDAKGKAYLDAYNNVPAVGHCHPHVVQAVSQQMATLNTHTRYLYDNLPGYAERLLATCAPELEHVMFTCSGSEATDLAIRLARRATGRRGIIVSDFAYHGNTQLGSDVSPTNGASVPIGVEVRTVPAPLSYRASEDVGVKFARDIQAAIDDLNRHGIGIAGLLVDSVFSSDGLCPGPAGFLKPAVDVVHAAGGIYIADEVQPGFARLGEAFWGFQRHGVLPDIVTMGKPMGNGLPIAGLIAQARILETFGSEGRYFNTFGGNPVCIAAANAVLDVIESEELQKNARETGAYIVSGLKSLQQRYECMGDVRGAGLSIGVEFVKDRETKEPNGALALNVVNRLRDKAVLISASGPDANVLKIRPPLPFKPAHADQLLGLIDETLKELQ